MTTNPALATAPRNLDLGDLYQTAFGRPMSLGWQRALVDGDWPEVLIAPTGSGKTAGVTLAWAHRRLHRPEATPRRLIWCMPMRTLVDQAAHEIRGWMARCEAKGVNSEGLIPRPEDVHVLMGGADSGNWRLKPERPLILVGTQDMLLSRALMRGYACSRAAWPMEFALLHRDAQWVFDEVQLMGAGRATSAQLEAFRRREHERGAPDGRSREPACRSLWISATLEPEWLKTVDHPAPTRVLRVEPAKEDDPRLLRLAQAAKHLHRAPAAPESSSAAHVRDYLARLAESVADAHRAGRMTLVIVNQVKRAQELYARVGRILGRRERRHAVPKLVLLHSRFRAADREREMERIRADPGEHGIIVISTQAVEAGVDVSATVMVSELAPWASMVQRFGRANRRAEVDGGAEVHWIDLLGRLAGDGSAGEKQAVELSRPYDVDDLCEARDRLAELSDVAPVHLPPPGDIDPPLRVIRRKDLDELFDTDSDLTGFDVDISAYVRDAEDTDVRVFWRDLTEPADDPPKPSANELCAVPIGQAKKWIQTATEASGTIFFRRDPQWRRREGAAESHPPGWPPLSPRDPPWPGLTILADVRAGGYREDLGFTGNRKHRPAPVDPDAGAARVSAAKSDGHRTPEESDGYDEDPVSQAGRPVSLAGHRRHVVREVRHLAGALLLRDETRTLLLRAARWHDVGKAHEVFQDTMRRGLDGQVVPDCLLAKTVLSTRHKRHFRHELASGLAFLAHEGWRRDADLTAYLIVAHHGKVRMNLRALPRETGPKEPERAAARFARGVWEGDRLPPLDLGGKERWEGGRLTLSVMELGWDEATGESWTERTRDLLAQLGPFRLAWLETLLRIADQRASAKESAARYDDA